MQKSHKTFSMIKEREKLIISYISGNITANKAAQILQINTRHFFRLVKKYNLSGIEALERKPRTYEKKYTDEKRHEVILLYEVKYYDCNFVQFLEFLEINEGLKYSYSFIYKLFNENGILSPYAHRKTVRSYKKRVKQDSTINSKEISDNSSQDNSNIFSEEKPRNRINTPRRLGWIVEFDASEVKLANGEIWTLHLGVDIGTSTFVGAYFDKSETLNGYLHALYQMLSNYGKPKIIKTDNRSGFRNGGYKGNTISLSKTTFRFILDNLGIELNTTSICTGKAHIERANSTFQNRIPPEIRMENIVTIEEANKFLENEFLPKMNNKFSREPITNEFIKIDKNDHLDKIIGTYQIRKFDNAGVISFKGEKYYPSLFINGEDKIVRNFAKGTECLFIKTIFGETFLSVEDTYFKAVKLSDLDIDELYAENREKFLLDKTKFCNNTEFKAYKKKDTPWRLDMYRLFVDKTKL